MPLLQPHLADDGVERLAAARHGVHRAIAVAHLTQLPLHHAALRDADARGAGDLGVRVRERGRGRGAAREVHRELAHGHAPRRSRRCRGVRAARGAVRVVVRVGQRARVVHAIARDGLARHPALPVSCREAVDHVVHHLVVVPLLRVRVVEHHLPALPSPDRERGHHAAAVLLAAAVGVVGEPHPRALADKRVRLVREPAQLVLALLVRSQHRWRRRHVHLDARGLAVVVLRLRDRAPVGAVVLARHHVVDQQVPVPRAHHAAKQLVRDRDGAALRRRRLRVQAGDVQDPQSERRGFRQLGARRRVDLQ